MVKLSSLLNKHVAIKVWAEFRFLSTVPLISNIKTAACGLDRNGKPGKIYTF